MYCSTRSDPLRIQVLMMLTSCGPCVWRSILSDVDSSSDEGNKKTCTTTLNAPLNLLLVIEVNSPEVIGCTVFPELMSMCLCKCDRVLPDPGWDTVICKRSGTVLFVCATSLCLRNLLANR